MSALSANVDGFLFRGSVPARGSQGRGHGDRDCREQRERILEPFSPFLFDTSSSEMSTLLRGGRGGGAEVGLMAVNRDTQERMPRPSARFLGDIARRKWRSTDEQTSRTAGCCANVQHTRRFTTGKFVFTQSTLRNVAVTAGICPTLRHIPQTGALPRALAVENSIILTRMAQFRSSGPFGPDLA